MTYDMLVEHANIFMKQNLRIIKFGIYTEIENARYLFCDDATRLSEEYWPTAFRRFCIHVLKLLMKCEVKERKPDLPDTGLTESEKKELIEKLELGSAVVARDREKISMMLESSQSWLATQRKDTFFSLHIRDDIERIDWPSDLRNDIDLLGSWTTMSLRDDVRQDDVRQYIWDVLSDRNLDLKFWKVHYFGAGIKSQEKFPILIEVTVDDLEKVRTQFKVVSDDLRTRSNESYLLPDKIIGFREVPARDGIELVEEGLYTSGSPGTLGAIQVSENKLYGITCAHVYNQSTTE